MKLDRAVLAFFCLALTQCDVAPADQPTSELPRLPAHPDAVTDTALAEIALSAPRSSTGRSRIVPIARVRGYGNPQTGEIRIEAEPLLEGITINDKNGVQANAQFLASTDVGYCEIEVMNDGVRDSNPADTWEFYTADIDGMQTTPGNGIAPADTSDDSSFVPAICAAHVPGAVETINPHTGTFTGLGVGCALQHVGNFTSTNFTNVYLDVDVFNGDAGCSGPYGPPYGDNLDGTGAVTTPGTLARNEPQALKGLWSYGAVDAGMTKEMWIYFQNCPAAVAFDWTGFLLGEVVEDCGGGSGNGVDEDCDGVMDNGCGIVETGGDCYTAADCASGYCHNAVLTSGIGEGGTDLAADMPGVCQHPPEVGDAATIVLGQTGLGVVVQTSGANGMSFPQDVSICPVSGKVFVADTSNHRVLRFAAGPLLPVANATAEIVIGQENFAAGQANRSGSATGQTLSAPESVFCDHEDRLWVSDTGNRRVLRFDNASTLMTDAAANRVLGQPDFTSTGAAATQTGMSTPRGLFVETTGRLWVADYDYHRVLRYDNAASLPNGGGAAGVLGQGSFVTGNSSNGGPTGMTNPLDVHVDVFGRLWVTDHQNHRAMRFDDAHTKPLGGTADGVLGQPSLTQGDPNAVSQSTLSSPQGITSDSTGAIYIADRSNSRIMIWDAAAANVDGSNATDLIGQVDYMTGTPGGPVSGSVLNNPAGITFLPGGTLVVADKIDHRVLAYDRAAPMGGDACVDSTYFSFIGPLTGTTVGAANDFDATCVSDGEDVVFTFEAPGTGTLCFDTLGSSGDPVLVVQDTCGGTELACDDDSQTGLDAQVELAVTGGQIYHIIVDSFGASGEGAFQVNINPGSCTPAASGEVDPAFGPLVHELGFGHDQVHTLLVDSTDKVLFGGFSSLMSSTEWVLGRADDAGALDVTYGTGGYADSPFMGGEFPYLRCLALQGDGKVVGAGTTDGFSTSGDLVVARWDATGALDTTFDGDGFLLHDISGNGDSMRDCVVMADGRIAATGVVNYGGSQSEIYTAVYTSTGSLDATWGSGSNGFEVWDGAGEDDAGWGIAVTPAGVITVVGQSKVAGVNQVVALRYDATGTLDTTFSGDGELIFPVLGFDDSAFDVAVTAANETIIVGWAEDMSMTPSGLVVRLTSSGALDGTFDSDGIAPLQMFENYNAVVIQPSGKIVVAGAGGGDMVMNRFETTGALDTTFAMSGTLMYDGSMVGSFNTITDMSVDGMGRIYAGGLNNDNTTEGHVIRVSP